jgi:polynucleotide 5'-kinase involved in rRNA processing
MRRRLGRRQHPDSQVGHSAVFNPLVLTVFASGVESLKRGIIKSSTNKAKVVYTILLAGGTGVGKSSVLELIANVFAGRDIGHYNFDILDHTNVIRIFFG